MKTVKGLVLFFALSLTQIAGAQEGSAVSTSSPTKKEVGSEAMELPVPNLDPGESRPKSAQKSFSGVVNVLRQGERVEVVFKSGDVFSLPRGSKQHVIFKALQESEQSGAGVTVLVDERTGIIQSVSGGSGKPATGLDKQK